MALDGLTLGFLVQELRQHLLGARVDKITQPDHDLVVLNLRAAGQSHRLLLCATPGYTRLHLSQKTYQNPAEAPMFLMLMRKHLQGGRLVDIQQLYGDRLLVITFASTSELGDPKEKQLYFEAMGKHSNVSLVEDGKILDSLRHVSLEMSRVRQMLPGLPYVMPPRQDKLEPDSLTAGQLHQRLVIASGPLWRFLFQHISGLGQQSAQELALRVSGDVDALLQEQDASTLSQAIADCFLGLPQLFAPQLQRDSQGVPVFALPFPYKSQPMQMQQPVGSLSEAIETLYFEQDLTTRLSQRAQGVRRAVHQAIERSEKKLAILAEELLSHEEAEQLRVMGELLTAQIHQVPKGATEVVLADYYTGSQLTVSLDETLTPAQNAQRYFKRYRKAHTARKLAGEQREKALYDLELLEEAQYYLDSAPTAQELSEIRDGLVVSGLLRRQSGARGRKKEAPSQPMRYQTSDGISVSVGRNSLQNEALLKAAQPEDIWLHAKDVPGSHVLIHSQTRPVPESSLFQAAQLAAYYSKARGQQVQVDYTKRKLVRKISGGAPGQVHYSGEKGLLVSASENDIQQMKQLPQAPVKQPAEKKASNKIKRR